GPGEVSRRQDLLAEVGRHVDDPDGLLARFIEQLDPEQSDVVAGVEVDVGTIEGVRRRRVPPNARLPRPLTDRSRIGDRPSYLVAGRGALGLPGSSLHVSAAGEPPRIPDLPTHRIGQANHVLAGGRSRKSPGGDRGKEDRRESMPGLYNGSIHPTSRT